MKQYIEEICEKNQEEVCGLIIKNKGKLDIIECENISSSPENSFEINKKDFNKYFLNFKILAIFHSHVNTDENFSKKDLLMSNEIMIPFWVYSTKTKKHNFYIPDTVDKKLYQKQLHQMCGN
jgi:proteasome lid subunit RPN8/RPN11